MWYRRNSNRPRYNLLGSDNALAARKRGRKSNNPTRNNSRYRSLFMQPLEARRVLALIGLEINLLEDDGGSPGALIANDTLDVGDTFFAEITVQAFEEAGDTEDPGGIFSLQIDVGWDPNVLEEIDDPFIGQLVTVPVGFSSFFGQLDNDQGEILALAAGTTQLQLNVGADTPATFYRLHFRADAPVVDSIFDVSGSGGLTDLSNPNVFANLLQPETFTVLGASGTTSVVNINDPTITEGTNGTTNMSFDVTLSAPLTSTVDVDFAVTGGNADQGTDFVVTSTSPVNFQPGETSTTIDLVVTADSTVELDETIVIDLSNVVVTNDSASIPGPDAVLGDSSGTGTITNDDSAQIFISSTNVSVNEGDDLDFIVELTNPVDVDVSVNFDTADGTAVAPGDYTAASDTLAFLAGQSGPMNVSITTIDDNVSELDETLSFAISNLANQGRAVTLGTAAATGDILDDDFVSVSISDVTMDEGDSGETTLFSFSVSLDQDISTAVTVSFATRDGSATTGDNDYNSASDTLTFTPGGSLVQSVDITVNGDDTPEATEDFFVDLLSATNATINDGEGRGTIVADDAAIFIDDVTLAEGDSGQTEFIFTVTAQQIPAGTPVEVIANTVDGTATAADGDFVPVQNLTLTFDDQTSTQTVTVQVGGDGKVELDEMFSLMLSTNAVGITLVDDTGTGTITNDDGATISIDDVTVLEGDDGTTSTLLEGDDGTTSTLVFTVTLDNAVDNDVTVDFATGDGTATVSNNDYQDNNGTLTFVAGSASSQTIEVTVNGDNVSEADETLNVLLSNLNAAGRNVSITDGTGIGTIENDDAVGIVIDDVAVAEGDSGNQIVNVTVRLTAEVGEDVTVDFATADGSAGVADGDYLMNTGTITIPQGSTSATIPITIQGDNKFEGNDTLTVMLSNADAGSAGVQIDDAEATVTINNDDGLPTIMIDSVTVQEPESGTATATFTVSLSNPSENTVTVDFMTEDNSAEDETGDGDYQSNNGTLTFVGDPTNSLQQTISVQVNADTVEEGTEIFRMMLSNAQGATLNVGDNDGIGTIVEDSGSASLSGQVTFPVGTAKIGIPNVPVTLTGDNLAVPITVMTDANGFYVFADLLSDNYRIAQGDVSALFLNGPDFIGTQGGETDTDLFFNVDLATGQTGEENEFTVAGLQPALISKRLLLNSTGTPEQVLSRLMNGGSTGNGIAAGPPSGISGIASPQVVVQQDMVTVLGTDGYDVFEVQISSDDLTITVNDETHTFAAGQVSQVSIEGGGGGDSASLIGGPSDEIAQLSPQTATFHDTDFSYFVEVSGVDQITVDGGGGNNTADLFDSIGNDSLQIQPSLARLSAEQLANQVVNFDLVRAVSSAGGTDLASNTGLADFVLQLQGDWLGA